jgi:hypothetical protein
MPFVPESYRFSEDPAAGYSRLVFAFVAGSFETSTFGIDAAPVLGQASDLASLGDALQEFKDDEEDGVEDPQDLVKLTAGGLRVEKLLATAGVPYPRIKIGTVGGSPELKLERAWELIPLCDEIFLQNLTEEQLAALESVPETVEVEEN